MSALNNQTNRNVSRYFFATSEDGEQTLGLQNGSTGGVPNLSTTAVTISGAQGNGVVVNIGPQFAATEFILGEEAILGGGSGYFTASTLTSTFTGVSISQDRAAGSGTLAIENYAGNGGFGGFEFLSRGVDSALVSTTSAAINNYISSIGRPGATAVLGATGTFLTGGVQASQLQSLDFQAGGGGRTCFNIFDLSGAGGVTAQQRLSMGTRTVATGGNVGSDFTLYRYNDAGNFLGLGYSVRRSDAAFEMNNMSSIVTEVSTGVNAQVYPINKTNVEFGAEPSNVAVVAGASNQATPYVVLFSTPITSGANPNGQTFLSINWTNALSTGSNHVNFKVGFSTATAFTNLLTTQYIPGLGGSWTPSDQPGPTTPIGHTLITGCLDDDGVNPDGSAMLYVAGQMSDPNAPADQIFIAKGQVTEASKNALVWRCI